MEFSSKAHGVNPEGLEGTASSINALGCHELLRQKCMLYMGETKEAEPQAQAEVRECGFREQEAG